MGFTIAADPVPLRIDESGTVRVGKTRVLIDLVVGGYQAGDSPEVIVEKYTSLQLADVYAVIAYYLRHQEEVDAYLQERERLAIEIRRKIEAHNSQDGLRERLLARRQQQGERGS
jgi:uncharacterized protein (DUF433 family)